MQDWFVSKEEASRRLSICLTCPKLLSGNICSVCGCHMNAKTTVKDSTCPENKW
jgi:Family of unknown function (DUF6171)